MNLKKNLFTSTRLKLTAWYLLVFLLISGLLSSLFYWRISSLIDREFIHIQQRYRQLHPTDEPFAPGSRLRRPLITQENRQQIKQQLLQQLLLINLYLALVVGLVGYWLSGKTLAPIEQALERQRQFVADAAHELKTPVTALKTSIEVGLMKTKTPFSIRRLLKDNLSQVNGLDNLIERLLQLADDEQLQKEIVNIKTLVSQTVKKIKPLAQSRQITIRVDFPDSVIELEIDRTLIAEVLMILLDNAIKFSSVNSQVKIKATAYKHSIELTVQDQGVGIDSQDLPHVFDRFYQADSSRTKENYAGYGLGLALAKKIVELHGGKIALDSQPGKGTTAKLILPQ